MEVEDSIAAITLHMEYYMLRAISLNALGQPTLVVGITDENWRRLATSNIKFDATDLGLEATIIIFRARDVKELKAKAVEMGLADRSLLDLPEATSTKSQTWKPKDDK
jgi:hypothetical protein